MLNAFARAIGRGLIGGLLGTIAMTATTMLELVVSKDDMAFLDFADNAEEASKIIIEKSQLVNI
jgi:hypothetical protein